MKNIIIIFAVLITSLTIGSAFLDNFSASSVGSQIRLDWKTSTETNVRSFTIERRTINGSFVQISDILAKGSNSVYSFTDDNVYKTTSGSSNVYVYRLKIVDNDNNTSYSKELAVSHSLSEIKRTWGSIKAMFR